MHSSHFYITFLVKVNARPLFMDIAIPYNSLFPLSTLISAPTYLPTYFGWLRNKFRPLTPFVRSFSYWFSFLPP